MPKEAHDERPQRYEALVKQLLELRHAGTPDSEVIAELREFFNEISTENSLRLKTCDYDLLIHKALERGSYELKTNPFPSAQQGPPRILERLSWFALPAKVREGILGDLEEDYRRTQGRFGSRWFATTVYIKELIVAIAYAYKIRLSNLIRLFVSGG
jgi:hypothetical protein